MTDGKPMPLPLQSTGGEIYGHVFENPRTGLSRGLFWNLRLDFDPVRLDDDEWHSSLAIEWMTFPVRAWRELAGSNLATLQRPGLVECSLYILEAHHPVDLRHLTLQEAADASFDVKYSGVASVDDGDGARLFNVHGNGSVQFRGIIVSDTVSSSERDAAATLAKLISLDGLRLPQRQATGFLFAPFS